tara:strand:- start:227 stop:412 length:186 start_codon:yes stop_codon:yes gene_type:complete
MAIGIGGELIGEVGVGIIGVLGIEDRGTGRIITIIIPTIIVVGVGYIMFTEDLTAIDTHQE